MKCKNVSNLPVTEQLNDADGILITQGGKTVRMLMRALRAYIGYASGADVLGVPVPTVLDAGKVPVVKGSGDGYNLATVEEALGGSLATVAKTGNYNDLSNRPTIPTVPSSLPANGGNADTVDGYHASSFAKNNELATVAKTGKYSDLAGRPTIPTIPSSLPANGGNADTVDGYHASSFAPVARGMAFETWSVTLANNAESTKTFTGTVHAVLLNAQYKNSGAMLSAIWTPATSGIENRMYGFSGDLQDQFSTTVTLSGKTVKIKRGGVGSVTYYVTVLTK